MYIFNTLVLLPAAVLALKVTSPSKDSQWTTSEAQTVTFDKVSTDQSNVKILLVNQATYPPVSMVIGNAVDAASGSFSIPANKMSDMASGDGYQINLVSPSNDGILAQSGTFRIKAVSSSPSGNTIASTAESSYGAHSSSAAGASTTKIAGAVSTSGSATVSGTHSLSELNVVAPTATSLVTNTSTSTHPNEAIRQYGYRTGLYSSVMLAGLAFLL